MKAHDVVYFFLSAMALMPATTAYSQNQETEQAAPVSSMIGKKYTVPEDLGMYHFFSAVVGNSYLLESFSTSGSQFDARHIHVFLVELKKGMEERTIIDELMFDRNTDDSFSYIPIYDRQSNSRKEYFARYSIDNTGNFTLKEIYEFDPDSKKIRGKQPIPGMQVVEIDEL